MNLIDRYILKQFLNTFIFSILALYIIFLVVSLIENLANIIDSGAKLSTVVLYYLYYFPEILKLLTPVAMLLATLFSVGRMANLNEITAMKTGGMSMLRFMMPLLLLACFVSGLHLYFNGWIVPKTMEKKLVLGRGFAKNQTEKSTAIQNLHIRNTPNSNLSINFYNVETKKGTQLDVDFFENNKSPRISKRIEAKEFEWIEKEKTWLLKSVWVKHFNTDNRQIVKQEVLASLKLDINLKHEQLSQLQKSTAEMNFDELRNHINTLKSGGRDVKKDMTSYYGDYAYPFSNIIVILFVVPFASLKKKSGVALQITSALLITFAYLIFTKVGQSVGNSTDMSPLISAWLANIVFFILGVLNFFRLRI